MAFENLSDKLNNVFKNLRGKGRLSEQDVKDAMREVRLALLEADVSYKVVKDFIKTVRRRSSKLSPPPRWSSRSSTKSCARLWAARISG